MPSSLVDNILFLRPSAAVAARLPASLRALFFGLSAVLLGPRGVRSSFGASRSSWLFRAPFLPPGPPWRLVAPRAPRLSLRTCRLTPARFSALPRSARGCSRVPLFAVLRVSRAAQRRGVPCLPAFVFLLPAAEGGVALLPFVPVPLLPFRQPGPCLRLCLSSRLWRLFSLPSFLLPSPLSCPSPLATLILAFVFVLPFFAGPFLWLFFGFLFLFIVLGASIAR